MPEEFNEEGIIKRPHRNSRPPLEVKIGYGFGKKGGEPISARFKPDQDAITQAAEQGYDLMKLTREELKTHTDRLLKEYHRLLRELPESAEAYEEAFQEKGRVKEFTFQQGDRTYRVRYEVSNTKSPFLSISDDSQLQEMINASRKGVPEEELLEWDEMESNTAILEINSEHDPKPSLYCEGWNNNQEALRAANEWQQDLRDLSGGKPL